MFSIEVARKAGEDAGVGVLLCVCEIGASLITTSIESVQTNPISRSKRMIINSICRAENVGKSTGDISSSSLRFYLQK
jgi:hypothetical protein